MAANSTAPNVIEIITTVQTESQADELAQSLLRTRLAACIQVDGPITSTFRWQGSVCREQEFRCTIKTTSCLLPAIEQHFAEHHPYDTPQFIAISLTHCSTEYQQWVVAEVDSQ